MLYLEGMRIMMIQLSGFYYKGSFGGSLKGKAIGPLRAPLRMP